MVLTEGVTTIPRWLGIGTRSAIESLGFPAYLQGSMFIYMECYDMLAKWFICNIYCLGVKSRRAAVINAPAVGSENPLAASLFALAPAAGLEHPLSANPSAAAPAAGLEHSLAARSPSTAAPADSLEHPLTASPSAAAPAAGLEHPLAASPFAAAPAAGLENNPLAASPSAAAPPAGSENLLAASRSAAAPATSLENPLAASPSAAALALAGPSTPAALLALISLSSPPPAEQRRRPRAGRGGLRLGAPALDGPPSQPIQPPSAAGGAVDHPVGIVSQEWVENRRADRAENSLFLREAIFEIQGLVRHVTQDPDFRPPQVVPVTDPNAGQTCMFKHLRI